MAYIFVHPVYTQTNQAINYVMNPEKTKREAARAIDDTLSYASRASAVAADEQHYITGINCNPDNAIEEFDEVRKQFNKNDDIVCHHGWQSFPPELDISAAAAHEIGVKLLSETLGDRFQIVVTTHTDKEHIHNHFVINAVSFTDGKKYYGNRKSLRELRKANDEICKELNLPVIENPRYYGRENGTYRAKLAGADTWRELIKSDIDRSVNEAVDFTDFRRIMSRYGYLLKDGKHFAVSPPDFYKQGKRAYIRLKSLEDDMYTLPGIERRIRDKRINAYGVLRKPKKRTYRQNVKTKRKLPRYKALYYKRLYKLGLMKKKPKISAYMIRKNQKEAGDISKVIRFLKENKITTNAELKDTTDRLDRQRKSYYIKRKRLYNQRQRKGEDGEEIKAKIADLNDEISKLNNLLATAKKVAVSPILSLEKEKMENNVENRRIANTTKQTQIRRDEDERRSRSSRNDT